MSVCTLIGSWKIKHSSERLIVWKTIYAKQKLSYSSHSLFQSLHQNYEPLHITLQNMSHALRTHLLPDYSSMLRCEWHHSELNSDSAVQSAGHGLGAGTVVVDQEMMADLPVLTTSMQTPGVMSQCQFTRWEICVQPPLQKGIKVLLMLCCCLPLHLGSLRHSLKPF